MEAWMQIEGRHQAKNLTCHLVVAEPDEQILHNIFHFEGSGI
jgi:hypothetical protein